MSIFKIHLAKQLDLFQGYHVRTSVFNFTYSLSSLIFFPICISHISADTPYILEKKKKKTQKLQAIMVRNSKVHINHDNTIEFVHLVLKPPIILTKRATYQRTQKWGNFCVHSYAHARQSINALASVWSQCGIRFILQLGHKVFTKQPFL